MQKVSARDPETSETSTIAPRSERPPAFRQRSSIAVPASTPEEVVAAKLSQYGRSRRGFAHALAFRHGVSISDEVEHFFDAVETGNWEEIDAAFKKINGGDSSAGHSQHRSPALTHIWPAIIDAYGAAEQVHQWPAQQLLDYGNGILGSLRPGMVYVGGTDSGRWIPALLNDTSNGDQHVVITQNGLADATYLDYLRLQYEDRLVTLSDEDSQRAFQEYVIDAQKRLSHDHNHPDQPKQVRHGEDIRMIDGKTQVSGQTAVMAINEKLLQTLLAKNPDLSFALQESFPLKGTYPDALPLGPLMELGARTEENTFTAERAAQSLEYWREAASQILANPAASASESAGKSYSHDAVAAANLLAAHHFTAEAEQTYQIAIQLWPSHPEPVSGLADLWIRNGREGEARKVLQEFSGRYPEQRQALERVSSAWRMLEPEEGKRP